MTTTATELDVSLLYDLLRWAALEDAYTADPRFATWGQWDQGTWARLDMSGLSTDERAELIAAINQERHVSLGRNGVCRTAYCMAGQTVAQANYRLVYNVDPQNPGVQRQLIADLCIAEEATGEKDEKGRTIYRDVPGAQQREVREVGAEVLGLDDYEAALFFDGDNDLDKLQRMANLFCHARGLPLLYPDMPIYNPLDDHDDDDEYDD